MRNLTRRNVSYWEGLVNGLFSFLASINNLFPKFRFSTESSMMTLSELQVLSSASLPAMVSHQVFEGIFLLHLKWAILRPKR
jgi:hypothetical protein